MDHHSNLLPLEKSVLSGRGNSILELFRWNGYLLEVNKPTDLRHESIRVYVLNKILHLNIPDVKMIQYMADFSIWRFNLENGGDISGTPGCRRVHEQLFTLISLWLMNSLGMTLQEFLESL